MRILLSILISLIATTAFAQENPYFHKDSVKTVPLPDVHKPDMSPATGYNGNSSATFDYDRLNIGKPDIPEEETPRITAPWLLNKDSLLRLPSFGSNVYAYGTYAGFMGMEERRQAVFGTSFQTGRWSFGAGAGLEKYYMWHNIQNNAFFNGSVTYNFNDNWSVTAFGTYSVNPFYHSMAMFPYTTTSRYGGTVNWQSDGSFGLRLGAQREYDPFSRRWITRPIVAPSFKIGNMKMDIDLGPAIQQMVYELVTKKRSRGPIIMPPRR